MAEKKEESVEEFGLEGPKGKKGEERKAPIPFEITEVSPELKSRFLVVGDNELVLLDSKGVTSLGFHGNTVKVLSPTTFAYGCKKGVFLYESTTKTHNLLVSDFDHILGLVEHKEKGKCLVVWRAGWYPEKEQDEVKVYDLGGHLVHSLVMDAEILCDKNLIFKRNGLTGEVQVADANEAKINFVVTSQTPPRDPKFPGFTEEADKPSRILSSPGNEYLFTATKSPYCVLAF